MRSSSWLESLIRILLAAITALFAAQWMAVPAAADGDFLGVLKGSPPMSPPFINSPGSYDISSGPVTVVFTSQVENLTDHTVTVAIDINVHHILTYYGRNVADGEPSSPGITFKPGDAPNTTQQTYGTPFTERLTVQPKGAVPKLVTFSTVIKDCGYFQFDIGKHFANGNHDNLSSGFARVLGCKSAGGRGGGGGGGVLGTTAGVPLANTGFPIASGLLGAILVLIGGVGPRIRRH